MLRVMSYYVIKIARTITKIVGTPNFVYSFKNRGNQSVTSKDVREELFKQKLLSVISNTIKCIRFKTSFFFCDFYLLLSIMVVYCFYNCNLNLYVCMRVALNYSIGFLELLDIEGKLNRVWCNINRGQ